MRPNQRKSCSYVTFGTTKITRSEVTRRQWWVKVGNVMHKLKLWDSGGQSEDTRRIKMVEYKEETGCQIDSGGNSLCTIEDPIGRKKSPPVTIKDDWTRSVKFPYRHSSSVNARCIGFCNGLRKGWRELQKAQQAKVKTMVVAQTCVNYCLRLEEQAGKTGCHWPKKRLKEERNSTEINNG